MFIPQHLKVLDTTNTQLISCGSINNIQLNTLLDKLQNEISISTFKGILSFNGTCNFIQTNVLYSTGSSFFIDPNITDLFSITAGTQFICNTFPSSYPLIMYNTNNTNTFWRLGRDASNFGYMKYDSTANTISLEISGGTSGMVVSADDTRIATYLSLSTLALPVYPTKTYQMLNVTDLNNFINFDDSFATEIVVHLRNIRYTETTALTRIGVVPGTYYSSGDIWNYNYVFGVTGANYWNGTNNTGVLTPVKPTTFGIPLSTSLIGSTEFYDITLKFVRSRVDATEGIWWSYQINGSVRDIATNKVYIVIFGGGCFVQRPPNTKFTALRLTKETDANGNFTDGQMYVYTN